MGSTILIADDDEDTRLVLKMRGEHLGYRVLEAGNGEEALQVARRERPDVIVMDWTMPGMCGLDLLVALQTDRNLGRVPVIVVTGRDDLPELEPIHKPFACLMKPVSPQVLIQHIEKALLSP
jgi:two-component system chemotaxis response regulator CheY